MWILQNNSMGIKIEKFSFMSSFDKIIISIIYKINLEKKR